MLKFPTWEKQIFKKKNKKKNNNNNNNSNSSNIYLFLFIYTFIHVWFISELPHPLLEKLF